MNDFRRIGPLLDAARKLKCNLSSQAVAKKRDRAVNPGQKRIGELMNELGHARDKWFRQTPFAAGKLHGADLHIPGQLVGPFMEDQRRSSSMRETQQAQPGLSGAGAAIRQPALKHVILSEWLS